MAVAKFLCHAMVMYDILEIIIHIKKRLTLIVYRNELSRTLLSERETAGKYTTTIWSFLRVKMPPGVKSSQY